VCMVLGLATGGMPVSSVGLATVGCLRALLVLATGGTPVSVGQFGYRCVGNLGAWSCLDVIKSRCFSLQLNLLLCLSCYKPTYHYFPTLAE
jgi:hypothetical protein